MKELIVHTAPKSVISENIKILRTSLQFSSVDKPIKTLMITSSMQGEGKSFISSNLAVSFAQLGKRVLIVDCDMRRGSIHKKFGISNLEGLSNYLVDDVSGYNRYIQNTRVENVFVMTSGILPPNPSELLSSNRFASFIDEIQTQYDIVILDTPPVTVVPDACIIASRIDKTVIVAMANKVPVNDIQKTKKKLEEVNANIAGVVLNGTEISQKQYYNKYYN